MKKLLFLFLASAAFVSCDPDDPQTNPQPQPTFTGKWIPNWVAGDTLIGQVLDSNNTPVGYDTIYTGLSGDTSYITYNSEKIYVWHVPVTSGSYQADQMLYANCCISPNLTESAAYSYNAMTSASPSKYMDQNSQWTHQKQSLLINNYTHFKKVNGSMYRSQKVIQ